jgi:hypothetical protein
MKYLLQFSTPVEIQEIQFIAVTFITFRFQLVSKLMVGVQFRRIPAKGSYNKMQGHGRQPFFTTNNMDVSIK